MNYNNNIEIAGKYKLQWWSQPELYANYQTFLSKLGYGPDVISLNQRLTNLHIETVGSEVRLNFSPDWDGPAVTEKIQPGVVVEDEEYQAIWYRSVSQTWSSVEPRV